MFIAGQIVSGVALVLNTSGRLSNKPSTNMIFTSVANLLVAISFYLLGGYMGVACMLVASIRTFVFYLFARNEWNKSLSVLIFFTVLYLASCLLTFTNWLEYTIIALKGISYTYGAWQSNPQMFRGLSIFSCALTIWYNAIYMGYVNIISEALCIIFTLLVMIQEIRKSKNQTKASISGQDKQE